MSDSGAKPRKNGRRTQAERTALSDQRMFDSAIRLANYRFGSKYGLILELFARFDERWKEHLDSYVGNKRGIASIKAAADALRDFLKLESDYMRAMYILWYESLGHESEIRSRLADHHRVYREDAARWISEGIDTGEIDPTVDAEQFAVQYCAFIFGTVYQWLVSADELDLDALFEDYETNVERLLKRRKSSR